MTIASEELFELYKQVYEATGLADTIDYFYLKNNGDYSVQRANHIQVDHNWWKLDCEVPTKCFPLYTSDYLLKKLPKTILSIYALVLQPGEHVTTAGYYEPDGQAGIEIDELQKCATTIEALLRLTLELHEEKLL